MGRGPGVEGGGGVVGRMLRGSGRGPGAGGVHG